MGTESASSTLMERAERVWAAGDGPGAIALFDRAYRQAEADADEAARAAAVLGLARGQRYNASPGSLPVRLHEAYEAASEPGTRARLAAALARCWAYANEPRRATPFADAALREAGILADPVLEADALDAALVSHWGPDDLDARRSWALRLGDVAAHLRDPEARLQAGLWELTVAWEVLDLPRMHRSVRAIELLADESARARFFAASRRLPVELLRGNVAAAPRLIAQAEAAASTVVIPDAYSVLHSMRGYTAFFAGDARTCAATAPAFEEFAVDHGAVAVRSEAAVIWLGAGRLDKVAEMVGAFTPDVLAGLPRDSDWLLTQQCLLEGGLAVADRDLVEALVTLVEPYAGRSVVNAGAVMWHGVTDDTLARARALLGDHASAAQHRAAALATYDRLAAVWWRERLRQGVADGHGPAVVHFHEQPGGLWRVGTADAEVALPRMRGLAHLHAILSRPGTDLSALELAGNGEVVVQGGLEVLDDEARRLFRARLAEIDLELDDAPEPGRGELRRERDALAAELAGATGLAGRDRRTGGHDERARVAVRKAIVAALARIAETDPWLARHLHERVHTGTHCRYDPDPDHPVTWVLRT